MIPNSYCENCDKMGMAVCRLIRGKIYVKKCKFCHYWKAFEPYYKDDDHNHLKKVFESQREAEAAMKRTSYPFDVEISLNHVESLAVTDYLEQNEIKYLVGHTEVGTDLKKIIIYYSTIYQEFWYGKFEASPIPLIFLFTKASDATLFKLTF